MLEWLLLLRLHSVMNIWLHVAYFYLWFHLVLYLLYIHVTRNHLNTFKRNGISHCYQLDISPLSVFAMSLCASVYMCFVVTCWERADLLALVCGVYCEFVTFPLVSWVWCGTWLYRFLIFASLLTLLLLDGIFHCYSNLDRTLYKQTVETLIRCCILRCLIWVCTIYLFTTKRTLAIIWVKRKTPYICRNSELFYAW